MRAPDPWRGAPRRVPALSSSPPAFPLQFGAELAERLPPPLRDLSGFGGGADRAARLRVVATVREPALAEPPAELGPCLVEVARTDPPQSEGAHAGRVDQLEVGLGHDQPGGGGGVPPLP